MQNSIRRILSSLLALLLALILVIILLPFALLFVLIAILFSCFVIVRSRRPPKGTIEILPPEEEPDVKSTSDVDLEITVESLQQKGKGSPLEPKQPSGPS
jgi:hypothetical protein